MAANKIYTVKKNGRVLKAYRSLPSAKQLAEKEMANVYCEDVCIYKVVPEDGDTGTGTEDSAAGKPSEMLTEKLPETPVDKTEVIPVERTEKNTENTSAYIRYRLTAKMNVRSSPSFDAGIAAVLNAGTEVDVKEIADDWMCLPDGTYIWYNGGKFAEKTGEGE